MWKIWRSLQQEHIDAEGVDLFALDVANLGKKSQIKWPKSVDKKFTDSRRIRQ